MIHLSFWLKPRYANSRFSTIPYSTLLFRRSMGKSRMEKTIHSREYGIVLRLLRETRKRARLTQVEMAKKLDLTQSQVSKIERGEHRIDIVQLRTFCNAAGVTLKDFVARLERELTRRP
jgi:DNA-binding XRE family transcriptional regulator